MSCSEGKEKINGQHALVWLINCTVPGYSTSHITEYWSDESVPPTSPFGLPLPHTRARVSVRTHRHTIRMEIEDMKTEKSHFSLPFIHRSALSYPVLFLIILLHYFPLPPNR